MNKEETNKFIEKWENTDREIKAMKKNENLPIICCPEEKTVLFYLWRDGELRHIWHSQQPVCSIANKLFDGKRRICNMISSDPEKNYIRHMEVDAEDIESAIIWLHKINGISYAAQSVVNHPYFIPATALGEYLEKKHHLRKPLAKKIVETYPMEEFWTFHQRGKESVLYPAWAVEKSIDQYMKRCSSYEKDDRNVPTKTNSKKKEYVIDGIPFTKAFKRKVSLICSSLRVPFTEETVTLEALEKYVFTADLYHVNGLGEAGIRDFLKELKQNGVTLKEKGEYSLAKDVVNPMGITKDELMEMTVWEAGKIYFGKEARDFIFDYCHETFRDKYVDNVKMEELLAGISVEKLYNTKHVRKKFIPNMIHELSLAGITVPEK